MPERLPVAAVGASAGGLEAVSALVRALPADAPLAVVVVQHLDPVRESNLVELLSRQAAVTVQTASDGAQVRAGCVYVIPPGADLRIDAGKLRLVPRLAAQTPHLPIDDFFVSLARERGSAAMGVVLSGTGADGSAGVRALKDVGASTFAQDGSAQHSGMPEAAVATGCVDAVLPPDQIAAELVVRAREIARGEPTVAADGDALSDVFVLLRRASGIDFSSYKPSTLQRRIQRRAAAGRHESVRQYIDSLANDAAELDALAEDMLIHVTSFFRDPAVFDALTTAVLPKLIREKSPGDAIRVWVPGCSTGEEVYSLVIALAEQIGDAGVDLTLKVFGTDLSETAIERARAGRYPAGIEAQVTAGRLQRFFVRTEGGYQIRKELRDQCVFARQDITRDPPFSNIDLVSCRNLMIYLAAPVQRRVIPIFHYALRPGGVLLLGASESPGAFGGFEPLDSSHRIYVRTAAPSRLELVLGEYPRWPATSGPARAAPPPASHVDVHREADRVVLAEFAPPGVIVADDLSIVQFRGQTGPYLEPVPGAASLDLLKLAREELRVDLRSTIERARQTGTRARQAGTRFRAGESERRIDLEVIPLLPPAVTERHFVVLFHEQPLVPVAPAPEPPPAGTPEHEQRAVEDGLRQELGATRAYLQSVIEQLEAGNEELRAANEEVVSSNEELQSTNEELQTAKEELQSTNEELSTVNDEMVQRNVEARRINDDLTNVLSSVGIAIVLLGRDSRIRRFTPEAARLMNLIATDVGRPLSDINSRLRVPDLLATIRDVLEKLTPREQTITDAAGRWYQLTVRPYVTMDSKIDGTVLSVVDVDTIKRGEQLLAEARDYAECIVDTVRDPLVVLDEARCVVSANRAFLEAFGVARAEVTGKPLEGLRDAGFGAPSMKDALDRLAQGKVVDDVRCELERPGLGKRSMVLSGRPVAPGAARPRSFLLAFVDVTERVRSEALVRRSETALRDMLEAASEAIVIAGRDGLITFANAMASRTFGYTPNELVGLSIETLVPEDARGGHAGHRAAFHDGSDGRPSRPSRDLRGRRKDGSVFPIEVTLSSMEGEHGPLAVAFISDITERKANEERIRKYRQNLQEMAFDAAVAEEKQRRQIATGLHDNIGQALALAQIRLTAARQKAGKAARGDLDETVKLIARAISDMRSLTFELSPPVLYDLGLPAAVGWLGEQLEAQHGVRVAVASEDGLGKLDDETAAMVFRAVRELLTNVAKHAKTKAATVSLRREGDALTVVVEDTGAGFDPSRISVHEATQTFGLFSVREQITRLGGSFAVDSVKDRGTKITLRVPVTKRPSEPPSGEPT